MAACRDRVNPGSPYLANTARHDAARLPALRRQFERGVPMWHRRLHDTQHSPGAASQSHVAHPDYDLVLQLSRPIFHDFYLCATRHASIYKSTLLYSTTATLGQLLLQTPTARLAITTTVPSQYPAPTSASQTSLPPSCHPPRPPRWRTRTAD